jgi:hypothetical protein
MNWCVGFLVLPVMLLIGCAAGRAGDEAGASYVTLRAPGETHQMRIGADGQVISASFQLRPTTDGYQGSARSGLVSLRSDGERITGLADDRPVDLHLSVEGEVLRAPGVPGGAQLGRAAAGVP